MLDNHDLSTIVCPVCHGALQYGGAPHAGVLKHGAITCTLCRERFALSHGFPRLYRERDVRGNDRLMRLVYNSMAPFHNLAVRMLLPLFQQGSEEQFRSGYIPSLELDKLRPRDDGRPLRILEVGIGAGANLPWLRAALPKGLPVEIWGCDLSLSMLLTLRRDLAQQGGERVRLMFADAHALPFPDHSFDRVFHVGGINGFRDPGLAMKEMARVAAVDSPIVVVDEHLDSSQKPNLYHRSMFKLVTWYDEDPHCPIEQVPAGAIDVVHEQLSLFFYSLRFRMPAPEGLRRAA